jgi:hypothetical protein
VGARDDSGGFCEELSLLAGYVEGKSSLAKV